MQSGNTSCTSRAFSAGETIFREGDPGENVYQVEQGRLQVYTGSGSQRVVIGEIGAGEFVGELGVLLGTARSASVIALESARIRELDKNGFLQLLVQDCTLSLRLLHLLSCRTRHVALLSNEIAEKIAERPVKLPSGALRNLLHLVNRPLAMTRNLIYRRQQRSFSNTLPERLPNGRRVVHKNRVLFLEGQPSHYACRIVSGSFRGIKSLPGSHRTLCDIQTGEFVGEIGLLEDTPRNLTVVAREDAEIDVFDEERFLQMLSEDADKRVELIRLLSHRAIELNRHLQGVADRYAAVLNPSLVIQTRQLIQSIGELSYSTGGMLERDLYHLQQALKLEAGAMQNMLGIYYRSLAGKASREEMEQANAEFRNFLKTLGFGAMLVIPGSFITIPLAVKIARACNVDILPKSRIQLDD